MTDDRISIRISRSQKEKLKELGGGSITQGFEIVMSWLEAPTTLPPHPDNNEIEDSKEMIKNLERRISMLERDDFWMSGPDAKMKISSLRQDLEYKKVGIQKFELDEISRIIQNL